MRDYPAFIAGVPGDDKIMMYGPYHFGRRRPAEPKARSAQLSQKTMPHVLFVCTANICRSPVAAGLLRDRLQKQGRSGWTVSSAGTWAQAEQAAALNSVRVMASEGIDISSHLSREVSGAILAEADLILCMEGGHAEALRAEFEEHASRIYLLSEMVDGRYDIKDPYGGPLRAYEQMARDVRAIIDDAFPRIVELASSNAAEAER